MPTQFEIDENSFDTSDIDLWLMDRTTQFFLKALVERFDVQQNILGVESGTPIDRLKGHAEVIHYILNPREILELDKYE